MLPTVYHASIDVGTYSTRMIIASLSHDNLNIVLDKGAITRLGSNMGTEKRLSPNAITRTIKTIQKLQGLLGIWNVKNVLVTGSGVLREAKNKQEFIDEIKKKTGLELKVVSGKEEAYYSYHGSISGFEKKVPSPILVDVGGGSTEIVWKQTNGKLKMLSTPLGALKLTEKFFHHDPPTTNELQQLGHEIINVLGPLLSIKRSTLVGVGGSINTIASIILKLTTYNPKLVHGQKLSLQQINNVFNTLKNLPLDKRKLVAGLPPDRADIILAGAIIASNIMKSTGFNSITVSTRGLRFGIMLNLVGKIPPYKNH